MNPDRQRVAEISAQDDQDTLGDVDDVEHSEDQRQADGHQGVDAADEDAIDNSLVDLTCHRASWSSSAWG